MKLWSEVVISVVTATAATVSLAANALAANLTQTLNFNTTGQSMWAEGATASFSSTTDLTTSWNNSGSINPVTIIPRTCIPLTRICTNAVKSPSVTASTDGTGILIFGVLGIAAKLRRRPSAVLAQAIQ